MQVPKFVLNSSETQQGTTTGGSRKCGMEGCPGRAIGVRWPDGKLTWPCSYAMNTVTEDTWKIR